MLAKAICNAGRTRDKVATVSTMYQEQGEEGGKEREEKKTHSNQVIDRPRTAKRITVQHMAGELLMLSGGGDLSLNF